VRVLSGITASGIPHLGNYFGAIRQHVALQDVASEALYFIADYHSMTSVRDAVLRREYVKTQVLDYLACGLDPERAILFRQSDVSEVCELQWILSTVTPMGLLERSHAYKDKLAQGAATDHGLFAYPVLMAADILLYNADLVPVGQDQKQHLEMTRDIAAKFNLTYGQVFTLPEPQILDDVAVVPGIDGRKMSKSYGNTIGMFDDKRVIQKAVMAIVTDSTPVSDPKDPGAVVFQLWNLFATAEERREMAERAKRGGLGYGEVKKDLLQRLLDYFAPMRERRAALERASDIVEEVLDQGARRARRLAAPTLEAVRDLAGLGVPPR
jgi:tryptophanyl-tRNA synthetase